MEKPYITVSITSEAPVSWISANLFSLSLPCRNAGGDCASANRYSRGWCVAHQLMKMSWKTTGCVFFFNRCCISTCQRGHQGLWGFHRSTCVEWPPGPRAPGPRPHLPRLLFLHINSLPFVCPPCENEGKSAAGQTWCQGVEGTGEDANTARFWFLKRLLFGFEGGSGSCDCPSNTISQPVLSAFPRAQVGTVIPLA